MSLLYLVRAADPDESDRTVVLDAALAAFLDYGIKRTSMGEIAKRARISPATLYRRFPQKNELVQAVALREARRLITDMDSTVDHEADAVEQITELTIALLAGMRENELLARLLATDAESLLPLITVEGEPVLSLGTEYLTEFITRLQAEGKLPSYDAEPVAELIVRMAHSLVLTPQTRMPLGDERQIRRFVREHMAVLFRLPPATAASETA